MKMKTHSGAKKRFRFKKTGILKRRQAGLRHLLSHKSSKRKRHLGQLVYVNDSDLNNMKRLLPGRVLRGGHQ